MAINQPATRISLRPSRTDDIAPMYVIHRAASYEVVTKTWGPWDEEWQQERFRTTFNCDVRQIIEVDGLPAGFIEVQFRHDHLFLMDIELAPAFQRHGIGTFLIRDILARASSLKQPVRLQVLKVNLHARRLYERLGFVQTGETQTHFLMQAATS